MTTTQPEIAGSAVVDRQSGRLAADVRQPALRRILFGLDMVAVTLAWTVALFAGVGRMGTYEPQPAVALAEWAVVVAATLAAVAARRLYLARVCAVRTQELQRIAQVAGLSALFAVTAGQALGDPLPLRRALVGGALAFVLLSLTRGVYADWLRASRQRGRFTRPILLVGTNREASELSEHLRTHPELGFVPVGVVGERLDAERWQFQVPYLGGLGETAEAVAAVRATGVLVASTAVSSVELNSVTRELLRAGVHVHLSTGLRGIDHRRLRPLPFAREPIFYVEAATLSRWQFVTKRIVDVVLASTLLVLTFPALLLSGLAVKLEDRGPLLFRQQRVGRHGRPFTLYKLRTMHPDAEARLGELAAVNERADGPLFKVRSDPRRTRVGRLLEATSLDELPQLWNVLRGDMSLVGPRPALMREVAEFDEELLARQNVPPGITGLWQVEARDNPLFGEYRRLDLFYIENWSVTLDLIIMLRTAVAVVKRLFER